MKGLSVNPPWGTLIAIAQAFPDLGKHVETRGWPTKYRGELAIHQTKGLGEFDSEAELAGLCRSEPFRTSLTAAGYTSVRALPRGKIVAVVNLIGCEPTDDPDARFGWTVLTNAGSLRFPLTDVERAFGGYDPGRFGFLLADIRALAEPVACRGMQGLWDVPADVEQQIRAQLAVSSASAQR